MLPARAGACALLAAFAAACSAEEEAGPPPPTASEQRALAEARSMIPAGELPPATPAATETAPDEQ